MDLQIIISCVWAGAAGFCAYNWQHARRELKAWKKLENNQAKENFELREQLLRISGDRRPLETVSAEIARTITELQNENAQLRVDVETGCRIIDEQRKMVTTQTDQLTKQRKLLDTLVNKKPPGGIPYRQKR